MAIIENPVSPAYYQHGEKQPIEIMQEQMSHEEFEGFLRGNIIKYALRYGRKDDKHKEATKIIQYGKWLLLHSVGEQISPNENAGESGVSSCSGGVCQYPPQKESKTKEETNVN